MTKTGVALACMLWAQLSLAQVGPGASATTGWLPPGESWFEFSHRIVNTGPSLPTIDRFYRGKFEFGWWKPIYSAEHWQVDLTMIPYFVYGGFHERRILLPAFSFRGELAFRYFLGAQWELRLSNLHYSTHLMDKIPADTPQELQELSRVKLGIDDINLIRLGVVWRYQANDWLTSADAGLQRIKLNYWLITEVDRMLKKSSYSPYDRLFYFNIGLSHTLGSNHRLSLRYEGEFSTTLRSIIELTYGTKLSVDPWSDGLQVYLSYEGGNIGSNEVAITPYRGISRDWLRLGLKFFN